MVTPPGPRACRAWSRFLPARWACPGSVPTRCICAGLLRVAIRWFGDRQQGRLRGCAYRCQPHSADVVEVTRRPGPSRNEKFKVMVPARLHGKFRAACSAAGERFRYGPHPPGSSTASTGGRLAAAMLSPRAQSLRLRRGGVKRQG